MNRMIGFYDGREELANILYRAKMKVTQRYMYLFQTSQQVPPSVRNAYHLESKTSIVLMKRRRRKICLSRRRKKIHVSS